MAQHGLSPAGAILAATAWAAELLKVDAGRLREGWGADAVILRRDPLEDVSVLIRPENIAGVVKDGVVVWRGQSVPSGGFK